MSNSDGEEVICPPKIETGNILHPHLISLEARTNGVKHFGHDHPLTFKGFEDKDLCCNGCGFEIGSNGFSCMNNCGFVLHEFCAFMPKEMKDYPKHTDHTTLNLCTLSHCSRLRCHVCDVSHRAGMLFHYHCGACDFSVDLRCASTHFLVCGNNHPHNLTALLCPASFLCTLCGEKHGELGMSYKCGSCWFWIHEKCFSLADKIQHESHVHPLQLYHLTGGKTFPNDLCGVCVEIINPAVKFYYCINCNYGIHIKCSTKKREATIEMWAEQDQGNSELIQFPMPSAELAQNRLAQFIQNLCQWKDEKDKDDDILIHPSHDHPLTRDFDSEKFVSIIDITNIDKRGDYDMCNACMLPLLNAPLYRCNQSCKFVLHKWCAKLPCELKHPAHADEGHTLILQERLDKCFGFFRCKGCKEVGNGFAYKCNVCEEYYLDVRCASLPSLVNYETHDHPLLLKQRRSGGGCISCGDRNFQGDCNCKGCNYSSTISPCSSPFLFGCDTCHFYIDIKCLILPREILHWYDEHGFKLTDSTQLLISDEGIVDYHCEFCEKKAAQNRWIYHCSECKQCLGTECVRKSFGLLPSLIKFGGCYDSPHHVHPLTSIAISEKKLCNRCQKDCFKFGIGFQCTECEIVFGLECAYSNG